MGVPLAGTHRPRRSRADRARCARGGEDLAALSAQLRQLRGQGKNVEAVTLAERLGLDSRPISVSGPIGEDVTAIIAMTREMATLGQDVAAGLAERLGLEVVLTSGHRSDVLQQYIRPVEKRQHALTSDIGL